MSLKYKFKTKPRNYQVRALKKALRAERAGLWLPMRAGKTKVAIDWASILHLKYGIKRVLIITHSPTTFGVWESEIRKHCPLPHSVGVQNIPHQAPQGGIEFLILNIHLVYDRERVGKKGWAPIKAKWLHRWSPEVIIVDEATCIGDPTATQSQHLYRLQRDQGVRFKLLLSGTPLHRNLFRSFGQFKFMDDSIFGTAYGVFKSQFGLWGGYGQYTLLKYTNLKLFRDKVEPFIYQLHRIPHRPPTHQVIPVTLSPENRDLYRQMETESVARINGNVVTAPIVLTKLLKCSQIAAGWIRDEDQKWHRVGDSHPKALATLLEGLLESDEHFKVVIYAKHVPELQDCTAIARAAGYTPYLLHGGVPHAQRASRIAAFWDDIGPSAFISQVSTGSMGIDLSCADTTIYYTLTESLLHKDQADARTLVHGSKRPRHFYYIIAQGTVHETMYLALNAKMDLVNFVQKHPQLIHHTEKG